MKNVLEQLRWDVLAANGMYDSHPSHVKVTRVLDTFISQWQILPLAEDEALWRGAPCVCGTNWKRLPEGTVALVPRTQEPTLLEAVKKHKRAADALYTIATVPESTSLDYMAASQALATAISKEQSE